MLQCCCNAYSDHVHVTASSFQVEMCQQIEKFAGKVEAMAMQENGSNYQSMECGWAHYLDTAGLSVSSVTSQFGHIQHNITWNFSTINTKDISQRTRSMGFQVHCMLIVVGKCKLDLCVMHIPWWAHLLQSLSSWACTDDLGIYTVMVPYIWILVLIISHRGKFQTF
jgi:hypothetical protein